MPGFLGVALNQARIQRRGAGAEHPGLGEHPHQLRPLAGDVEHAAVGRRGGVEDRRPAPARHPQRVVEPPVGSDHQRAPGEPRDQHHGKPVLVRKRQQRHEHVALDVPDLLEVAAQVVEERAAGLDDRLRHAGRAGGEHDQAVGKLAPRLDVEVRGGRGASRGVKLKFVGGVARDVEGGQHGVVARDTEFDARLRHQARGGLGPLLAVDEHDGGAQVHQREQRGHVARRVLRFQQHPGGPAHPAVPQFGRHPHRVGFPFPQSADTVRTA